MLELRDLAARVGARTLWSGLHLTVEAGTCTVLLGPNGVGKSTLLHIAAGVRVAQGGAVSYRGRVLHDWSTRSRAALLALLPQRDGGDFWGSTLDYVALGRYPHGEPTHGPAARGAAADLLDRWGLSVLAGQPLRRLSGGERQLARLAQCFVQDCPLLIMDEPLQQLDFRYQSLIAKELRSRREAGASLLLALHEPHWAARLGQQVVLMYDGGVTKLGASAALLTRENLESLYACRLDILESAAGVCFLPA